MMKIINLPMWQAEALAAQSKSAQDAGTIRR